MWQSLRVDSVNVSFGHRLWWVDAFIGDAERGNPAVVVLLERPMEDQALQQIAFELGVSETAFVRRVGDGWSLRWFTPTVEVDLCGHATLATAHVLWSEGHLDEARQARFQTRSGLLTADREAGWITLDFPATPVATGRPVDIGQLTESLNASVHFAGHSCFDLLVEVQSEAVVRALEPSIAGLAAIPVRGVIVTARAETPGFDFVSRFFAPNVGIDEDPVCGSAHCCLGPYWSERLGKTDLKAWQISDRGGVLKLALRGDRVRISGQAVTVLRANLDAAAVC